jgi:hypothetical protein
MSNSQRQNNNGQGKRKRAGGQNGQPKKKRKTNNNGNARPMGQRESVPSAQFQERPYREPRISRNKARCCVIGQEEFLVNVTGSTAFAVQQSFAINPGLAASFPWLSIEAQGWERYKFRKLAYRYTTSTGSTVPGTAIMAPDYDAADAAPASEQVALTYKDRQYCPPWETDKLCRLSPSMMNAAFKEHFVRTGALAANQDVKTYDVGNLHICTSGGTAVQWGKVFVEYEVEFFNPQLPAGGVSASAALVGAGTMSSLAPFGTAAVATGALGLSAATDTITITGLQVGQEIAVCARITGTTVALWNPAGLVGLTTKNELAVDCFNGASTQGALIATYTVTAPTATIAFSCTAVTVTSSSAFVCVLAPAPSV